MNAELKTKLYHPAYAGVSYLDGSFYKQTWEFTNWPQESMSWKQGCSLHGGLSGSGPLSIKGPDAKKYLESICINSFAKFPIGSMKHVVMCNKDGLIDAHGIIERLAEDHFTSYAGGPPGAFAPSTAGFDVEINALDWYLFQISGPTSLGLLEKLTGEDLHDLKFLHLRNSQVLGKYTQSGRDIPVEIARIGMSRTIAFELHGPADDSVELYDAVVRSGEEFGLERIGWNTYFVNHTEGGFPQCNGHFLLPCYINNNVPGFANTSGSVDPADMRARYRTPVEVAWGNLAKPDHDYVGRSAVEAEIANPKRTTVTLRWNAEDVLDVWASMLKPGESLPLLTMPQAPYRKNRGGHQDHVLLNGREVGYSSGIVYSYYFREFLSLGCVDLDVSELGTDLNIRWGDYGHKTHDIRASVEPMPYLSKGKFGQLDKL